MRVNVHCGKDTLGLGVIGCHGSMPAETCVDVRNEKLRAFDINLYRRIVCVCTDGGTEWVCVNTEWIVPEAERVFSSAGNVVARLRNRLNDEVVNAPVFLKTYYSCRRSAFACKHYA